MDDTILFEISANIDRETGIVNYYEAFMPKMYDDNGMPTPPPDGLMVGATPNGLRLPIYTKRWGF